MVNILNYSNSFVNPIAYVFRIPEFQQALRSCCTKRKPAVKMVKIERRDQNVATQNARHRTKNITKRSQSLVNGHLTDCALKSVK